MKYLFRFAAAASVLFFPFTSNAQTAETDTLLSFEMEELIVTASKYEESPQTVGRNVTVISGEEIRQSVYSSVADILAEQQSIHIIGNGQTPGSLQQGFIRSSNSNHLVVLIDGIRISDPSTPKNSLDLSELSVTGIKRIEIVRGSHSTLYGSSAIGGVINIITKKKGRAGFNANISTSNGTFNSGTFVTSNSLFANYTFDSGWYANAAVFQEYSNGFDASIDTINNEQIFNPQDRDSFNKLDLTGEVGFKNERYNLFVSYRNIEQKVETDAAAFNDDGNAFTEFNRDLFSYRAGTDLLSNLRVQFSGAYSDLQRDFVNDSSLVSRDNRYDGIYVETNAEGTLWKNELKSVYRANNFQLVGGLSASVQTMNIQNYIYSRSQFGVFESETNLDSLNLRENIYSAYLHADVSGGLISERLNNFSLVLGARYAHHNEFGSHVTYEINPKYQISESSIVYAAVTTGFNAPSLYQLYSPNTAPNYFTDRGNPNLEPETSVSYEIGLKQRLSDRFSFEVILFNTQVDNVIEYIYLWEGSTPINQLSFSDYRGDTYINLSEQNIRGIEIAATARLGSKISLNGHLSYIQSELSFSPDDINVSYTGGHHVQTFENGRFVTGQTELEGLARRPVVTASLSAAYQATESLYFEVNTRFTGPRDDVFYSTNLGPFGALGRSELESYNITNVSARYRFSEHFSVTGKVENIFNADYTELIGYRSKGRGFFVKLRYNL